MVGVGTAQRAGRHETLKPPRTARVVRNLALSQSGSGGFAGEGGGSAFTIFKSSTTFKRVFKTGVKHTQLLR